MKQKSRVMQQALREGDPMAIHSLDASSPFSERTEEETKVGVSASVQKLTARKMFYGVRKNPTKSVRFCLL